MYYYVIGVKVVKSGHLSTSAVCSSFAEQN